MITLGELKIHPKLYAAAVENMQFAPLRPSAKDNAILFELFSWDYSPQRYEFWDAINRHNIDHAKSLHPELFEEEAKPQYDSIQIGCKKPKEPEPLSYLRNDHERKENLAISERVFRKRYS